MDKPNQSAHLSQRDQHLIPFLGHLIYTPIQLCPSFAVVAPTGYADLL